MYRYIGCVLLFITTTFSCSRVSDYPPSPPVFKMENKTSFLSGMYNSFISQIYAKGYVKVSSDLNINRCNTFFSTPRRQLVDIAHNKYSFIGTCSDSQISPWREYCSSWKSYCSHHTGVQANCKKTCNKCNGGGGKNTIHCNWHHVRSIF